ncbi:MAG: N-acetylmuramoyl-L-alanine amidase, partial [Clostridia bacterium]|nr:N-acetylmuramoyl-L-alanine amidase [Clostridia bacterium]
MNYRMRLLSALLVVAMVVGVFVIVPTATDSTTTINAVSDADFVAPNVYIPDYIKLPDDNLLTNNTSFIMAQGTAAEIKMTTQFITSGKANRPGNINYQKYIVIHNTGAYPSTSTALANHNYGRTTTADVSWHYTCGNDGLYQMLPLNERGWHAGGNYWGSDTSEKISDLSNSTGIGIETATPGIHADDTFSGVLWNQAELYEWFETVFDKTSTYLAMLVAYMCVKLN